MARILELMQLSPTMKTGTFVHWLKKPGDAVSPDDVVAEIETDKAVMEMQAFDQGILLGTLVEPGEQLPVGAPIAIIGEMGEDISDLLETARSSLARLREETAAKPAGPAAKETPSPSMSVMARAAASAVAAENIIPETELSEAQKAEVAEAERLFEEQVHGKRLESFDPLTGEPRQTERPILETVAVPVSSPEHVLIDEPSLNGLISLPAHLSLARSIYRTRHPISPLARRLAEGYRIDVSLLQPADGQRVRASDVEEYQRRRSAIPGMAEPPPPDRRTEITEMRRVIATRLSESATHIPHYYLTAEFDAGALVNLRETINLALPEGQPHFSINDFIVRGCALALKRHPVLNSSWRGDHIIQHNRIDIGIAVALKQGLITPVVRNADRYGLSDLAARIRDLVKKAQDRKLRQEEYSDGTFTVSNLGMFGIREFTAIINEPEAAIMAVGGIVDRPAVKNGKIVPAKTVTVTLSCDHRIVDGAEGASFLKTFVARMENPSSLLV